MPEDRRATADGIAAWSEARIAAGEGVPPPASTPEHVRSLPGATELRVSWVPEPGGPAPFYLGLGFEPTGEMDGDEVVARLRL